MSKERKREDDDEPRSDEGAEDRPTVTPPLGPADRAEAMSARPSPARGVKATGEPPSSKGGARTKTPLGLAAPVQGGALGKRTPLGLGAVRAPSPTLTDPEELEDARRRSMASSPAQRKVTPVGALSLANVHAPSSPPPPKKEKRDSLSSLSAVDDEWEELATTPPPPDQQALIEASARDAALDRPTASEPAPSTPRVAETPPTPPATPAPPPPPPPPPITEQEMNDRVAVGDYSGALAIAEQLLDRGAGAQVEACAEECRAVLRKMYRARLGTLDRVPVVMVARDQLRWLSIDHRAGFVLSLIDGVSSLEMILDVTGMPELDALRILSELLQQRIISLR